MPTLRREQTFCIASVMSALRPKAVSALPPEADIGAAPAHVRYGQKRTHAVQQTESLFERLRWSGIPASPAFFKPSLTTGSDPI